MQIIRSNRKYAVCGPQPREASNLVLGISLIVFGANAVCAYGQATAPAVAGTERVDTLLRQMTPEEKMALIRGASEDPSTNQGQAGYLAGVPRLGISALRMSDGPPGVLTRLPSQAETATMGLAATFSRHDAEQNGVVIAREAKSLGIDVVLEPFINIDRDITFGRGYNTFGEDPVLTGAMGAEEIRGIQGQGVMAMAKHYVAYDSDANNIYVDAQALQQIYVAPFKDAVDAGVSSIMCSYNRVNGVQACGNSATLIAILRDQLGFKGFVTSDWGAVHAADYINKGLDVEMPGTLPEGSGMASMMFTFFGTQPPSANPPPPVDATLMAEFMGRELPEEPPLQSNFSGIGSANDPHRNLWNLMQSGEVKEEAITRAARRVLWEMNKFGYLDHPPTHGMQAHATDANAKIIEKTAADAAVLLKNDAGALPLKPDDLQSLALIGPGAGQVVAVGIAGERSTGIPERQIGPLQALKNRAPDSTIAYAAEDDMTGSPIPAANLSHAGTPGLLRKSNHGETRVDAQINFTTSGGTMLPADSKTAWQGTLTVPKSGSYWIYLQLLGAAGSVSIDGKRVAGANGLRGGVHGDTVLAGKDGLMPTKDGLDNVRVSVTLSAGDHPLSLETASDTSGNPQQIRLAWVTPEQRHANHDAAIAAAKKAKAVVVFAWTRGRPDFNLPGDQDKLIDEIASVNAKTIVVLNVSQPVALPWLGKVKAVVQMWWPGDEGGWATADILLGRISPAGRLPFTWAKQLQDYAATNPRYPERSTKGVDGKTTFSEGIHVGYRWFDLNKIEPLFPFGYGLSYTRFDYANLKVSPAADKGLDVQFDVKNAGDAASDEVPQVYLGRPENPPEGADFAVHALAGFDRIHLGPGQSKTTIIHVPLRQLQYWSTRNNRWVKAAGPRAMLVGRSSCDLPLFARITINDQK
jgi:beta-glucosidase